MTKLSTFVRISLGLSSRHLEDSTLSHSRKLICATVCATMLTTITKETEKEKTNARHEEREWEGCLAVTVNQLKEVSEQHLQS